MRRFLLPFLRYSPVHAALATLSCLIPQAAKADNVITIGDSLTAEYEYFAPDKYPSQVVNGFDPLPTDYARITGSDAQGNKWISRSWVEVLGLTRGYFYNFGGWRGLSRPWAPPRLSGYEYNWAVPGATAAQYREFMTSSFQSSPLYYSFRLPLDRQLRSNAKRVVIWLGANDLGKTYGTLYQSAAAKQFGDDLIDDLTQILAHVKAQNPELQIVLGNLADIGASPKVQAAFPDSNARAAESAAIEAINTRIAQLATDQEVGLADVYAITKKLVANPPEDFYFGAIKLTNAQDENNDPHCLFTRDGFHPNTPLQVVISRAFIRAFNLTYDAGVVGVTDAEALRLLKISPREPYQKWLAGNPDPRPLPVPDGQRAPLKDPDFDGLTNLMEYAFDSDPTVSNVNNLPFALSGPVDGIESEESITYIPAQVERRDIDIAVQYKFGGKWIRVPADHIVTTAATDTEPSRVAAAIPLTGTKPPLRIKVTLRPPQGSLNTMVTVYAIQRP